MGSPFLKPVRRSVTPFSSRQDIFRPSSETTKIPPRCLSTVSSFPWTLFKTSGTAIAPWAAAPRAGPSDATASRSAAAPAITDRRKPMISSPGNRARPHPAEGAYHRRAVRIPGGGMLAPIEPRRARNEEHRLARLDAFFRRGRGAGRGGDVRLRPGQARDLRRHRILEDGGRDGGHGPRRRVHHPLDDR